MCPFVGTLLKVRSLEAIQLLSAPLATTPTKWTTQFCWYWPQKSALFALTKQNLMNIFSFRSYDEQFVSHRMRRFHPYPPPWSTLSICQNCNRNYNRCWSWLSPHLLLHYKRSWCWKKYTLDGSLPCYYSIPLSPQINRCQCAWRWPHWTRKSS